MTDTVTIQIEVPREIAGYIQDMFSVFRKKTPFVKPSLEDVQEFCLQRNSPVCPEKFFNYYNTRWWRSKGGELITDWKSKLIDWEKRETSKTSGNRFSVIEDWANG